MFASGGNSEKYYLVHFRDYSQLCLLHAISSKLQDWKPRGDMAEHCIKSQILGEQSETGFVT